MEYLFQDGGKPKKVGRPKSKASKNDKKTKTTKSKTATKSKKRGNFLGSVGELVAPTGCGGFASAGSLLAIDRAGAALRIVKKEKINNMKGGNETNNPNNWVFDKNGYARVGNYYVDYDGFNPRQDYAWWSDELGVWVSAVHLSNLYEKYKSSIQEGTDGCKIIKVIRKMSRKRGGQTYERIFWVDERLNKVCISPLDCSCVQKKTMSLPSPKWFPNLFPKKNNNQSASNLPKNKNQLAFNLQKQMSPNHPALSPNHPALSQNLIKMMSLTSDKWFQSKK